MPAKHKAMATTEVPAAKAKKPRPPFCYRCKCNGHLPAVCKADLNCIICNKKDSHLSIKCPILKMPKPNASLLGFGKNELGFLQVPDFDYKLETTVPAPTALVTITGGHLGADGVQTELARLIRADWNWEALPHGKDSFLVTFPSEEELKRMADVEFRLKNHGVALTISEWQEAGDVIPSYELDMAWVHVTGVPHAWRHYLGFWALGSVIGATEEVDMLTFRKLGVIRIKVGIMDREHFPFTTDVVFGKHGYELIYTIEPEDFQPAIPTPSNDTMDHDSAGTDNGSNMDGGSADHAAKKKKANTSTPESSNAAVSGPTPMQLAVTPFGDRRPVPQRQQIILGTRVNKQHIAVTPLRVTGSTSYGRREVSLSTSTAAPAAPTLIVLLPKSSSSMDTPPGLTMAVSPPTPTPLGWSLTSTPPPSAPVQTLPASTPPM